MKKIKNMFFLSKKSISIICVIVLLAVAFSAGVIIETKTNNFKYAVIVIDAGHGGLDGGSVSKSGVKESDLTLEIAKRLEKQLKKDNFEVVMTRETKDALSNNKLEDMKKRAKIIQRAQADCVVSIHINTFKNKDRRGAQVFYDDTNNGRDFAFLLQGALNEYVNKKFNGIDNFETLPGDFYITKCSSLPSVIIECGFLSNNEDEKLLQTKEYQETLVKTISTSLVTIFANTSV